MRGALDALAGSKLGSKAASLQSGRRREAEIAPGFVVGRAAKLCSVVDQLMTDLALGAFHRDRCRRRRADELRNVWHPLVHRSWVVAYDVVDPGRATVEGEDRGGCRVVDVNERKTALARPNDRERAASDLLDERSVRRVVGAGPVEKSVSQDDAVYVPDLATTASSSAFEVMLAVSGCGASRYRAAFSSSMSGPSGAVMNAAL